MQNTQITYHEANINPSLNELIENKKEENIFKHLIKGPYGSWDKLLNNMFYLMREVIFYIINYYY